MPSVADVAQQVRRASGESISEPTKYYDDSAIVAAVNRIAGMLTDQLIALNNPLAITTSVVTVSASSEYAYLPSYFKALRDEYCMWDDPEDPLQYVRTRRELDIENTGDGTPVFFTVDKQYVWVSPPPSADTNFTMEHYGAPEWVVLGTDELPYGTIFLQAFIEGVKLICDNAVENSMEFETSLFKLIFDAAVVASQQNEPRAMTF